MKTCGAQPFLDEAEIQAGQDFEAEILVFLKKAHELVVLLTPWSLNRPYVWVELGAAWIRKIPIVVLLQGVTVNDLQSQPSAPVFLKKGNCRELNNIDSYFSELKTRVKNGHRR